MVGLLNGFKSLCRRTAEGSRQSKLLVSSTLKLFAFLTSYTIITGVCLGIYFAVPIKTYFVDNELVALMPVEILFCDPSTTLGFTFKTFVQILMGVHLVLISYASTVPLFTYILTYDVEVNILGENFNELDEMWTNHRNVSLAYRHAFLFNMCKKRQDMNKFVNRHSNFTFYF